MSGVRCRDWVERRPCPPDPWFFKGSSQWKQAELTRMKADSRLLMAGRPTDH